MISTEVSNGWTVIHVEARVNQPGTQRWHCTGPHPTTHPPTYTLQARAGLL
jgi:hypothetical protein